MTYFLKVLNKFEFLRGGQAAIVPSIVVCFFSRLNFSQRLLQCFVGAGTA
jgi:hypothetical protein